MIDFIFAVFYFIASHNLVSVFILAICGLWYWRIFLPITRRRDELEKIVENHVVEMDHAACEKKMEEMAERFADQIFKTIVASKLGDNLAEYMHNSDKALEETKKAVKVTAFNAIDLKAIKEILQVAAENALVHSNNFKSLVDELAEKGLIGPVQLHELQTFKEKFEKYEDDIRKLARAINVNEQLLEKEIGADTKRFDKYRELYGLEEEDIDVP